jgi:hypothetical protein
MSTRLQNRVFGEVKGAALKGSIEIDDKFGADSKHQNEMISRYDSLSRVISRIRRWSEDSVSSLLFSFIDRFNPFV